MQIVKGDPIVSLALLYESTIAKINQHLTALILSSYLPYG